MPSCPLAPVAANLRLGVATRWSRNGSFPREFLRTPARCKGRCIPCKPCHWCCMLGLCIGGGDRLESLGGSLPAPFTKPCCTGLSWDRVGAPGRSIAWNHCSTYPHGRTSAPGHQLLLTAVVALCHPGPNPGGERRVLEQLHWPHQLPNSPVWHQISEHLTVINR